jgi:DNA (cytosine-5)-methyltransferase 1
MAFSVLELCAGAGGQALGLEMAGFETAAAMEIEPAACETLRTNRPQWEVLQTDLKTVDARNFRGIDVLAGGVPCPPFSIAGKQLGPDDERDLFPSALRIVEETEPKAVMLENVRGLATARFDEYRAGIIHRLKKLGYISEWQVLYASKFGLPQLRPRFVLVALKEEHADYFRFPEPIEVQNSVGECLFDLMASGGWGGAKSWKLKARGVGPTIVGGSKKHGGADLGPTRAKRQWLELGVDGKGIANNVPDASSPADHVPRLTLRMVARLQGFPDAWSFSGGKTAQYRQIGNAFPPPVACAVGIAIRNALLKQALPNVA